MSTVQLASPVFRTVRFADRSGRRRGCRRLGCAWLLAVVVVTGCRGRAEFTRGRDFYDRGQYRSAYREFWEAYRISPSEEYLAAFRQAATRVAVEERLRGQDLERGGELEGALAAYSLGLEYDSQLPTLRDDYTRLWTALSRKRQVGWTLQGSDPRSIKTWDQLREARVLSAFPGAPDEWQRQLPQAVRSVAEAQISPLVRATHAEPLPREEEALDALIGAWEHFEDECRLYGWEEETVAFGGSWGERSTSRWVEVRDVLRPFLEEAEVSLRKLTAARRALGLVRRGEALEQSGDLVGALWSYRRARFEFPEYEVAGDAELRVSHRFSSVSRHVANEAMDEGRWETAVRLLEELLQVTPDDAEAARRLTLARSQLAQTCLATARRHADAGRAATALLFASRAEELDPAAGAALARELREPVIRSFWSPLRIEFRRLSSDDWRLQRDLWAVDEQAMRRLEVVVTESARAASSEFVGTTGALDRRDESDSRVLSVVDLEFYFSRGDELTGADRFRYVGDFGLNDNQDHHRALLQLAAARRGLAEAEERRARARTPGRALAEELEELARRRVRQLEVQVRSLPSAVAEIDWMDVTHETAHLRRHARLSGYIRLGERSGWISVDLDFLDRVVRGRPEISLSSDPTEAPSREEVLLRLGSQLGAALAERVELWRRERLDDLLRRGVEQLEAGDRLGATEHFALVYYGRGHLYKGLGQRAAEHLEELLGRIP